MILVSDKLVCPWPLPENITLITFKEYTPPSTKNVQHVSYCRSEAMQSPFPEIDCLITQFVRNRACFQNPDAAISKALFFKDCKLLLLNIYSEYSSLLFHK